MSPEQAIQILDQVAKQVPATRETHGQIMQAIQVLSALVANSKLIVANEKTASQIK